VVGTALAGIAASDPATAAAMASGSNRWVTRLGNGNGVSFQYDCPLPPLPH
jgi:hypothetical protein